MRLRAKVKILELSMITLCLVILAMGWHIIGQAERMDRFEHVNERQEVMINKFNRFYQEQERQQAERLKEVAEMNGVGG